MKTRGSEQRLSNDIKPCALYHFSQKWKTAARARGLGPKRYILTVSSQKANPAHLIIKRRGNLQAKVAFGLHVASGPSRASGSCFQDPDLCVFPRIRLAVSKPVKTHGLVHHVRSACFCAFRACGSYVKSRFQQKRNARQSYYQF